MCVCFTHWIPIIFVWILFLYLTYRLLRISDTHDLKRDIFIKIYFWVERNSMIFYFMNWGSFWAGFRIRIRSFILVINGSFELIKSVMFILWAIILILIARRKKVLDFTDVSCLGLRLRLFQHDLMIKFINRNDYKLICKFDNIQ